MASNWNYSKVNQGITPGGAALDTNRANLRALVASLLAVTGASCRYSCDSVAAGAAGDGVNRWDADTDLVWNGAGVHSWFVIRFAAMGNLEVLIDLNVTSANGTSGTWSISPGGLFTGGTTSAAPTATDSTAMISAGQFLEGANTARALHVPFRSDGTAVAIVNVESSISKTFGIFAKPTGAHAAWTTPGVGGLMRTAGGAALSTDWESATGRLRGRFGAVNMNLSVSCEAGGTTNTPDLYAGANDITGRYEMWPAGVVSAAAGAVGFHGRVPDILWCQASHTDGDVLVTAAGERYAVFGDFALPWDASDPWLTNAAPTPPTPKDASVVAFSVAPTLSTESTNEGDLATDPNDARWTPVVLVFDAPADYAAVVKVVQGADSALWHVAFDGTTGEFSPGFEGRSTVQIVGAEGGPRRYTLNILPNGGWYRTPVTVTPFVAREVT